MNIVYILLAMALWGLVHSLTAALTFKEKMGKIFGSGFMQLYRLRYNVFAVLTFLPVMGLVATLPNQTLYKIPEPWDYITTAGQGVAVILLIVTVLQTDALHFIGLRQLLKEDSKGSLVTSGLYRIVRHPLYTFSLLFLWLSPAMSINTFVFYIGITLYFIIGALFEERKLLREFGEDYAAYKKSTAMLIPWLI